MTGRRGGGRRVALAALIPFAFACEGAAGVEAQPNAGGPPAPGAPDPDDGETTPQSETDDTGGNESAPPPRIELDDAAVVGWTALVDGGALTITRGGQGLNMVSVDLRGWGVAVAGSDAAPPDAPPPRLSVRLSVPGSEDDFAALHELPVLLSPAEDADVEASTAQVIIPDHPFPLSDVDGASATLTAELSVADHGLDDSPPLRAQAKVVLHVEVDDPMPPENPGGGDDNPPPGPVEITLVDVTAEAGLTYDHGEYRHAPDCLLPATFGGAAGGGCGSERAAGGVAVEDYDDDGDLDLFVTTIHGPNRLFQNDGSGHFVDVAPQVGLTGPEHAKAAAWADVDDDGHVDLLVTTLGESQHRLFMNDGSGHFVEQAVVRGTDVHGAHPRYGTGVSVGDYDRDGYLDVFFAERYRGGAPGPGDAHGVRLLHNHGVQAPGFFEDATATIDPQFFTGGSASGPTLYGSAFRDLDQDGWPELILIGGSWSSSIQRFDGQSWIEDTPDASWGASMGLAIADYDGNGFEDLYVSQVGWKEGSLLLANEGGVLTDDTPSYGVADGLWAWGTAPVDLDNDGDPDLVSTNGYQPAYALDTWTHVWRNDGPGAHMPEIAAASGLDDAGEQGRSVVPWDYDGDGDQDLFISYNAAPGRLWRNDTETDNHWVRVSLVGTQTNADGVGARLELRHRPEDPWRVREYGPRSFYLGHGDRSAHFGLGPHAEPIDRIRVWWPGSDTVTELSDVPVDQTVVVLETP